MLSSNTPVVAALAMITNSYMPQAVIPWSALYLSLGFEEHVYNVSFSAGAHLFSNTERMVT